jgi:hypothetical protein
MSQCLDRKFKQEKKSMNMIISEAGGTSGYGNLLPTVLSVCKSMCVFIFLCFLLITLA